MKVLVTGGTGFTGKALVKRLLNEGHQVVAMDHKEGLKTNELRLWKAKVIIGSVTRADILRQAMQGIEVVYHLAAAFRELQVPDSYYYQVNVEGTRLVLEEAMREGVRKFIYCSTCGVHGNVDNPPASEETPVKPADYYQQTKYLAESIVKDYYFKGLKTCILRPSAIYGPGDHERFFLLFKKVASGKFPMFGSGKTLYHPLYIDNLLDAFLLAQKESKSDGEIFLIADEKYFSLEDLVYNVAIALENKVKIFYYPILPLVIAGHLFKRICKPLGIEPPIFPRRVDWYRQNRAFNINKAKYILGYIPKIDISEGLRRTAAWYRTEGYLK